MKKRESNIELLRIIVMIMIIALHFLGGFGKILSQVNRKSVNFYLAVLLESFFIIAVNCFIFITGYFQIEKKKINLNKLILLVGLAIFYYVLLYFIGIYIGDVSFSFKSFIFTVIPLMRGELWFIWTYVILIILSPYINKLLLSLEKKDYEKLLLCMIIFFSIIPTFIPWPNNNDNGYGIVSFTLIYSIAAYIKLYKNVFKQKRVYLLRWFICSFTVFLLSLLSYKLINGSNAWGYNNIFNILAAMYLFLVFKNIKFNSKIIDYIATYCFAIYVIHINPSISTLIYSRIFRLDAQNKFVLIYMLFYTVLLFIGCILIEFVRRVIFLFFKETMFNGKSINTKYNINIEIN